ncbi:Oidioi.mRNA.OKI2018_I69.PAR.g10889.t1.cds [Oikopleura dioica]|uniref:Trafficking protein particle complex subunit 5 n=1 Tax=Oikopleura dioica TaxID=34765 RepID=A0ABN7S079_OIKDI|nr:Oidioi.mRNA.OKI2018_I69.PAR.g10889.t1.cds [Oikopleura dioica]
MSRDETKSILERPLSKGNQEFSLSLYTLLFAEMVRYCQDRANSLDDVADMLAEMGKDVGWRSIDLLYHREKKNKRDNKILDILLFIKKTLWTKLFGKEADKLEQAADDPRNYYVIEKEPIICKYISNPKDKSSLNCAAFAGGVIEATLCAGGFPCKVTTHWHKGTTFMIQFDESVVNREKA